MQRSAPYPVQAFEFVRQGLACAVERFHENAAPGADRHVSGQQLCLGLLDHALDRWGGMAGLVLERWGIRRTEDFGRIVFAMVDEGLLRATAQDSIEDFRSVFEFDEALHASAMRQRMARRAARPAVDGGAQ